MHGISDVCVSYFFFFEKQERKFMAPTKFVIQRVKVKKLDIFLIRNVQIVFKFLMRTNEFSRIRIGFVFQSIFLKKNLLI